MLAGKMARLKCAAACGLMDAAQIGANVAADLMNDRPCESWGEVHRLTGSGKFRLQNLLAKFYLPSEIHECRGAGNLASNVPGSSDGLPLSPRALLDVEWERFAR